MQATKCSRLFSAGSLRRSVESSLASHSDGLDLVWAVCAGLWKSFSLAYSRLFWITSVSFSNGDEKLNLPGWLELELLWDSVSKDLGVSFICLIVYCLMEIKPSCSAVKSYFPSLLFPLEWCFVPLCGLISLYISHQQYQKYQCYLL